MPSREKYAWNKKTDTELQLWPHTSTEQYLTRPFIDKNKINRANSRLTITSPQEPFFDFFAPNFITSSAITKHKGGYYQSRVGANFHLLLYTTAGGARMKVGKCAGKIKTGTLFISPAETCYEFESLKSGWNVFWFHLMPCKMWDNLVGREIRLIKSAFCDKLAPLVSLYGEQIYSPNGSPEILSSCADTIAEILKADLHTVLDFKRTKSKVDISKKILECKYTPNLLPRLENFAKSVEKTPQQINNYCKKTYGNTYSKVVQKIKMTHTLRLLKNGLSLKQIAFEVGFADAYCLSKSFKNYFGVSPKIARKNPKLN